jgi:hypothetical protein
MSVYSGSAAEIEIVRPRPVEFKGGKSWIAQAATSAPYALVNLRRMFCSSRMGSVRFNFESLTFLVELPGSGPVLSNAEPMIVGISQIAAALSISPVAGLQE